MLWNHPMPPFAFSLHWLRQDFCCHVTRPRLETMMEREPPQDQLNLSPRCFHGHCCLLRAGLWPLWAAFLSLTFFLMFPWPFDLTLHLHWHFPQVMYYSTGVVVLYSHVLDGWVHFCGLSCLFAADVSKIKLVDLEPRSSRLSSKNPAPLLHVTLSRAQHRNPSYCLCLRCWRHTIDQHLT